MPKIAAIIPAFNEEKTVANVIGPLLASKIFDEVIVICDGSTDNTAAAARAAGATTVHELPVNHGKGGALAHGLTHTDAPIVAFFDADLTGLTPEHAKTLVNPVLAGEKVMLAGWHDRGPVGNFLQRFMPLIGGERAMRREVFESIPTKYVRGYMIEAATDYYCRANGYPYGAVLLSGLNMRKKYQKVGWGRALGEYAHMYYQVAKAILMVRLHAKEFRENFIHEKHHDAK